MECRHIVFGYLLGGQLIAQRKGTNLQYLHQEHLGSTAVTTNISGTATSTVKYFTFGGIRSGTMSTDIGFTGQRTDTTGLYYYGARYYDPLIGRFISADTIISNPWNPQSFNRYSYCLNNPLKYIDPSGHDMEEAADAYYRDLCEENGIDPSSHTAIFIGPDGNVIGTVDIPTFAGWVDSPEPFDYLSQTKEQAALGKSLAGIGVDDVKSYHSNLTADPITVYFLSDNGLLGSILGPSIGGISLYPYGIFVKSSQMANGSSIIAHEGKHYSDQRPYGTYDYGPVKISAWLLIYYLEIAVKWAYYGGDYWKGTYNMNSWERAARLAAGDPELTDPIPTPWWQQAFNSLNIALSKSFP